MERTKILHEGYAVSARNPVSGYLLARYCAHTAEESIRMEGELRELYPGARVSVAPATWVVPR